MKKKNHSTITISKNEKYEVIDVTEIIRLEACGNNTLLYMRDKKMHVVSKRLSKFLLQLDSELFLRTHRSHAVNKVEIRDFEKGRCGNILMKNGDVVPFSAREKSTLHKSVNGK